MDSLADPVRKPRIDPLQWQVTCWENCFNADRSAAIHKALEACQLMCDVIVPNDRKQLFRAIVEQQQIKGNTRRAVTAYQKAPSKSFKTQILRIYANRFSTKELKDIHTSHFKMFLINK